MRVIYFDCFSGASGDMVLGALLDVGASFEAVQGSLDALDLEDWSIDVRETKRGPLRASKVDVTYGESSFQRSYPDITRTIEQAPLRDGVARRALETFARLAGAEARVHGIRPEEVHFHEVGAVDAIIDVVGSSAALEDLGPEQVIVSAMTDGRGITRSRHGAIPIPAPAVAELLIGVPIRERGDAELITPTGAAILTAAATRFGPPPEMQVERIGYGAGSREEEVPNVLRVMLGTADEPDRGSLRGHFLVEANLDDMSPELVPHVVERLLGAGADDAWTTSIVMKKGRPAFTLSALAAEEQLEDVIDVYFRETTTLGLRTRPVAKRELQRSWTEVHVEGYPIRVKIAQRDGEVTNAAPEYEDAKKVAAVTGLPLKEVYSKAMAALRQAPD